MKVVSFDIHELYIIFDSFIPAPLLVFIYLFMKRILPRTKTYGAKRVFKKIQHNAILKSATPSNDNYGNTLEDSDF